MLWKETFLSEAQMSPWLFLYSGWANLDKNVVPGDDQELRHLGREFVHVMAGVCGGWYSYLSACVLYFSSVVHHFPSLIFQ